MKICDSLKYLLKQNPAVTKIGYFLRSKIYTGKIKQYQAFPFEKHTILFNHFNGKSFADSPRAIAEYMHQNWPDWRLLWTVDSKAAASLIPDYLIPVDFESDNYFKAMATAGFWVFDVLVPNGTIKRNGQIYIQTWHGDKPFKKILNDASNDIKQYRRTHSGYSEKKLCDLVLTGSKTFKDIWRSAADYDGEFLEAGLPRNDCLFNTSNEDRNRIRKAIGISDNSRILLYAPTFRDHLTSAKTGSNINISDVLSMIEKKSGDKWVCIYRAHSSGHLELGNSNADNLIDLSSYPDIADLMAIADILITDYSSCAGDFALTGKPVILYQDDYESYTAKDRTLYFDMSDSSFLVAHSMPELEILIENMTPDKAIKNDREILDFFKDEEYGTATESVCKYIIQKAGHSIIV